MPEVQASAAPQSASGSPQAAGQSAAVQAPTIDPNEFARYKSEYERLAPLEKQFSNGTKFWQTAQSVGLKDEDTLKSWGGAISKATAKGINAERLAALFEDPEQQTPESLTAERLQEILDKRDNERSAKEARDAYERDVASETESFSEKAIRGIVGDKADAKLVDFLRKAAMGHHFLSRQEFPKEHALAGNYQPAGKGWGDMLKSFMNEGLTAAQAHKLARLGDAANRPATSTPAGNNAPGGKPAAKPDTSGKPREQVLADAIERAKQSVLA